MASTYDRWIHHGEPLAEPEQAEPEQAQPDAHAHHADDDGIDFLENVLQDNADLEEEDGYEDDRIPDLLKDMYMSEEPVDGEKSVFADMIEEAKRAAVEGGKFSRFTFTVKLLHVKSFYRISNAAFNAMLRIMTLQFPNSSVPKSYDEALSIISKLGLGYVSYHVCPNNCILYWKDDAKLDNCPKCNASRWRDADGKKQIPQKVLRHFPLTKRLQRMFVSKKGSEEVQWHKIKRQPVENEMSHPADGDAWKDFDEKYPSFASDARNIRLGLATDGFNPFGMSSKYSMWPVFVVPYNLPPWACMDQSNFMMALLIPGPSSPGKDFDVFMQPLVEELLKLWHGVPTYDALSPSEKFALHAAVIWCIHDFPALHTLSGRVTAGYQACVRCDKDPCSKKIRNKICFIGHRRFLSRNHRWRKSKDFNGEAENRDKPEEFTKEELQQQLERVKDVRPGKLQRKRKREEGQCWSRRSCLWDLPYWPDLKLRHNLDVMHIEKNIVDNLLGTFMNVEGKTKDTVNSRLDLEDMGIRKELHLRPVEGGESWEMPQAWYTMTKEEKIAFCEFIKAVRFPDGYASNLEKCVSADGCKLQGLKTHDCHILLQRILPAGLRGIMHKDIYEAVAELGNFFRELCCKTLKRDVLDRLEAEIPVILCKLEKIFPPAFFAN
jgi:rubrerythrin